MKDWKGRLVLLGTGRNYKTSCNFTPSANRQRKPYTSQCQAPLRNLKAHHSVLSMIKVPKLLSCAIHLSSNPSAFPKFIWYKQFTESSVRG